MTVNNMSVNYHLSKYYSISTVDCVESSELKRLERPAVVHAALQVY